MDSGARLVALARRLREAAARHEWQAIGDIDAEIATALAALAAAGEPSGNERKALEALQKVHTAVRLQCDAECARLASGLAELKANKEGWLAYGMNNESREELA